jgi:hypothetical protein
MEAILVPKYTEAIGFAVEALGQITVEEEEEEPERPTKKQRKDKDPYSKYPLPAVIATKEFDEDDYCGLHAEGTIMLMPFDCY